MTIDGAPAVIKASGVRESWERAKLERSLIAAKATPELVREIANHVEKDIRDGMRTKDIYAHAFQLLKRYDRPTAARYSLKQAIMQLGPSGFPFERFVARILGRLGYRTSVGKTVNGICVPHEVDVIAEKDDERILVEAKFHNSPDIRSDVKVALYVKARFDDISARLEREAGEGGARFHRAWLITNTNFTTQAIRYGTCAGLALTGWNHPKGHTLQDLIGSTDTHPVTCLTTLPAMHKAALLERGVVLCRDILAAPASLDALGISGGKKKAVLAEGAYLCPLG